MTTSSSLEQQHMAKPKQQQLSKRQRRALGSNPTTTWQQQPRIKSAGARARAYISYAGLADVSATTADDDDTNKTKNKQPSSSSVVESLLNPQLSLHSPEVKFGRLLGGTDQRSRHKAVVMLREYLKARSDFTNGGNGLSELDLLKLWKGLWYTLYMADKTPVQDKLSHILAELMWCLSGTEEEDEYAGQVYLQMENCGDGEGDGGEVNMLLDMMVEEDDEDNDENNMLGEDENGSKDDEMVEFDNDEEDSDPRALFGTNYNEEDEMNDGGVFEDEDGDTMEIIEMDNDGDTIVEMENDTNAEEDDEEEEDEEEEDEIDDEELRIKQMNESHCRGAHLVSLYISTFLRTVRREWGNVDKHRVDKFYTAVRYMVSEAYKYMAKRHWNLGIIRLINDVLYNEALAADTPGLTNGLRYHLIDICVDELAKVNKNAELQLTEATFLDCLEPFFGVAQNAEDKNVHKRVMDNVLLKFLNEYSFVSSTALEEEVDEEDGALIFNQVHVGSVSTLIFQIASDPDTDERYRKALYEMHKTYVRQVRLAGRDVDLDQYQDDDDEDDDDEEKSVDDMDDDGQGEKPQEVDEERPSGEQDDIVTSTKKKQHKQKKKKVDKESSEDDGESPDIPKTAKEEVSATPKTKSSKKKRKQKDCKTMEVALDAQEEESNMTTPKLRPSSKKKRKKEKSDDSESTDKNNSDLITSHVETPKVGESKKKKKKKDKSPPSVDPRSMNSPDQVVDSPTNSDNDDDTKDTRASKRKNRVSFGSMNHCKSHKASMKAIKTLEKERWDTAHRTPEKGILQTKIGSSSTAKPSAKKGQPPSSRKKKGKKRD